MTTPHHAVVPMPGYPSGLARLIWALEDTRQRTLTALVGLRQSALDWSAPDTPNSIGTLLYHIAAIEADWFYSDLLGVAIPAELMALFPVDVREADGRLSPVVGIPLTAHLERLARVRAAVLDALRAVDDTQLDSPCDMGTYQVSPAWIFHHVCQHEAEHRGQIGTLRVRAEL